MVIDEVSYYEYVGAIMDAERRDKLRRALGPANKASKQCIFRSGTDPILQLATTCCCFCCFLFVAMTCPKRRKAPSFQIGAASNLTGLLFK